jgi:4-hydroxy-tetrahydrodipicolinate synthase
MSHDRLRGRLRGAMTALATPFKDGAVDYAALSALVEWQIAEGICGLVPCTTTGEVPTLSWQERTAVIGRCVEIAAGQIPVIAGTGSNDTAATITFTAVAKALGADAALIATPYYNRPSQDGIVAHFEAIAREVKLPIIVLNAPSRTGIDLAPATLARLAAIPTIIGLADATGDLARPAAVSRLLDDRFIQLSAHDATMSGFAMMGGSGAISTIANLRPGLCSALHEACARGDFRAAGAIQQRLSPLIAALDRETDPIAVKYALHLLRGTSPNLRLPLTTATAETAEAVQLALRACLDEVDEGRTLPRHSRVVGLR